MYNVLKSTALYLIDIRNFIDTVDRIENYLIEEYGSLKNFFGLLATIIIPAIMIVYFANR